MQRISDMRVGGSARRDFRMFQELCGEEAYPNVIIATNMWGAVTAEDGDARERELATKQIFFKPILDKHATMLRHVSCNHDAASNNWERPAIVQGDTSQSCNSCRYVSRWFDNVTWTTLIHGILLRGPNIRTRSDRRA